MPPGLVIHWSHDVRQSRSGHDPVFRFLYFDGGKNLDFPGEEKFKKPHRVPDPANIGHDGVSPPGGQMMSQSQFYIVPSGSWRESLKIGTDLVQNANLLPSIFTLR